MSQAEKYPLHWPQGYPVTETRIASKFTCTFAEARDGIFNELNRLGADEFFISCNINRNKGGALVHGKLVYDNTGAAVYFKFKGERKVIACDKWKYIHENFRAIEKSLQAIRGLDRWGCTNIISQAVSGLKELASGGNKTWWQIPGVDITASPIEVKTKYKELIKKYHPDKSSGSESDFIEVQNAYQDYLSSINK